MLHLENMMKNEVAAMDSSCNRSTDNSGSQVMLCSRKEFFRKQKKANFVCP